MNTKHRNPENGMIEHSPLYNKPTKNFHPSQDEEDENFLSLNRDVQEHIIEGERNFFENDDQRKEFWETQEKKWDSWDEATRKRVNKFIDQYICD